jgi:hypothetical protein
MINFEKYNQENPQIYTEFKRLTNMLVSRGYKRVGSRQILEAIRWQTMISGNDDFKINNNYGAYYSRLFEKDYPWLEGIFEKRSLKIK